MDVFTIFAIAGCLLSGGVVYIVMQFRYFEQNQASSDKVQKALVEAASTKKKLLGYTKYLEFMEAAKHAVAGGPQALMAKVTREYVHVETIPKARFKLLADAKVIVKYQVEFTFGLDVSAQKFEVIDAANGIGLKMYRPTLSTAPVIKPVSHEIVSAQPLTDEKQVLTEIGQNFAEIARHYGTTMATEETVRAMCKLKVIEFFSSFLAKQPGVQHVPAIFAEYK